MAASATLYEGLAWLLDPANPTTAVVTAGTAGSVGGGGQRLTTKTRSGGVRTYGTGRVRNIIGANTVSSYALVFMRCTVAQVAQLEAWINAGTVLLFRDTYGQRDYGTIYGLSEFAEPLTVATAARPTPTVGTFVANGPFFDVAFTFNVITVPVGT